MLKTQSVIEPEPVCDLNVTVEKLWREPHERCSCSGNMWRGGGASPRTSASSVSPCGRTSPTPADSSIRAAHWSCPCGKHQNIIVTWIPSNATAHAWSSRVSSGWLRVMLWVVLQLVFVQMVDVQLLASGGQNLLLLLSFSLFLASSLLVSLFSVDAQDANASDYLCNPFRLSPLWDDRLSYLLDHYFNKSSGGM